jgi:hypothetical protein
MTRLAVDERGRPLPVLGLGRNQQIPVSAEPSFTEPFPRDTHVVWICPDVDCRVRVGKDVVADGTDFRIPANVMLPVKIFEGDRVSLVWNGGDEGMADIAEAT